MRTKPKTGLRRTAGAGLIAFFLPALSAGIVGAAEPPPAVVSLSEALRSAATGSQASVAARLDVDAAREGTARAKAAYWPSLSASGGWTARDHEVVAVFGTFELPTTQKNFFTAEVDATQLLWDGGRRSAALAVSRGSEDAAAQKGRADVQGAQLEALQAYLGALVLKAQRRVVDQRIASLEEHLRVAQDLYEQGVVARNDLLNTEVRLRVVKDQLGQIENGSAVAFRTLNRLMGRPPGEPLALPEALPTPPAPPESETRLQERAADENPRLATLRARLRVEQSEVAARKGESWPSLFAQASHTYQQNEYLAFPNANFLFVGLSWQVWENGGRRAEVRRSEIAAERTRTEIAELTRTLRIEVDRAFRDFTQALREADTAKVNIEASEESLRIEEDQYRAGLSRTIDVLDAEAVLAESRFALVNQRYTAYLKEGILLAAAGVDLPSFFDAVRPAAEER